MLKRLFPFFLALVFISCKKEDTAFSPVSASEYFPVQVGQYIDYDLDSTVFLVFGTIESTVHYQAREVVEDAMTDNLGRNSFRVVRYLRKDAGDPWKASITFMVTPLKNSVEVEENNLRYIKLVSPVTQDYSWKGNKFIDTYSTELNMNYLEDWDYTYDSVGKPLSYGQHNFDNTAKVFERDEFLGQDPSIPGTQYAARNFAYEKYAKGVGLIERNFLHWEYQAPIGRAAYYDGYGIKMTITGYGKN